LRNSQDAEVSELQQLGYQAIPLKSGGKRPILRDWQNLSVEEQWRTCNEKNPNLGLRTGSNLGIFSGGTFAVLDWDDRHSDRSLFKYFDGLGYDLRSGVTPVIRTPHGGWHVYLRLLAINLPGHSRHLVDIFGFGEIKYWFGSQVVTPPSVVNGIMYVLVYGRMDRVISLQMRDLEPIIKPFQDPEQPVLTLPGANKRISPQLRELIAGKGIERFPSRSEMEAAILSRLYLAGFEFPEALAIFKKNSCGGRFLEEFKANPGKGYRWLENAYHDVAAWVSSNPSQEGRQIAETAIKWAESNRWYGKAGRTDKACFLAHAGTALKYNRVTYELSARELAKLAKVSFPTSVASNRRLQEAEYVKLVEKGTYLGREASSWKLTVGS